MNYLNYFIPSAGQIAGLFAVLTTLAIFAFLGSAVTPGKRFAAVDVFVGWGVASGIFIVGNVIAGIPFTWLAYFLGVVAVISAVVPWGRYRNGDGVPAGADVLWRIFVLALLLIFLTAAMKASQWDEFSQWLPNAQYIFRHDEFPGYGRPVITSAHTAYPYALPLLTYLSSKLSGGFIENAGAMANLTLLLIFASVYIDVVRQGLQAPSGFARKWSVAAFGILGVTVLSTTFVQKLVLTAYTDSTTSVVLAVNVVLAWKLLETLSGNTEDRIQQARTLAWQFGWVTVILLNLKQANLVFLGLVLAGCAFVLLRDSKDRILEALKLLPIMVLPGLFVYFTWRYHVSIHLSDAEYKILPVDQWRTSEAINIFLNMLAVASKKGAFFVMMTGLSMVAIYGLWKGKGSAKDNFVRLGILAATIFIGFNVALWVLYIIAFEKFNADHVVSYWRFNTQLGLLGCTAAAYGVAVLWRRRVAPILAHGARGMLAGFVVLLVLALPVATAKSLRFDIRPQKDHIRAAGEDMAQLLPEKARLFMIDPKGNGLAEIITRYELTSGPGAGKGFSVPMGFHAPHQGQSVIARLAKDKPTHAWVFRAARETGEDLDVELPADASHLLKREGASWRLLNSWPYGAWKDIHDLPD